MKRSMWLVLMCEIALVWSSVSPAFTEASTLAAGLQCVKTGLETVQTDKPDYNPFQTVHISGAGYAPLCDVVVRVTRPDGSVVTGDGTSTPGSDTVTTDVSGRFAYDYKLNEMKGLYRLDVLGATGGILASATFSDAPPPCPADGTIDVQTSGGDYTDLAVAAANIPTSGPWPCTLIVHGPPLGSASYTELVVIAGANTSATMESQRIVVKADPPRSVTVTGVSTGPAGRVGHAFTLESSKFITIKDFNLTGSPREAISIRGDVSPANQDINVEGNDVHDNATGGANSGGIALGGNTVTTPRTWIFNNLIRSNGRNGISVDVTSNPTYIVNNTIFGNGWNGIQRNSSANAVLVNNLIVGNGTASGTTGGRWGLIQSSAGTATTITLTNNMFYKNSQGDIETPSQTLDATDSGNRTTTGTEGTLATGIAGCTFFAPTYSSPCTNTHAFTEIFVSATDFHLKTTTSPLPRSPAIDQGTNSCVPLPCGVTERVPGMDFDGDTRPKDGDGDLIAKTDIGYDEAAAVLLTPVVSTDIRDAGTNTTVGVATTAGTTVRDHVTVSGSGPTPTGTVDFTFYTSLDCSTGGTAQNGVALVGGSADSSAHGPLAPGSYSFKAHYNGDTSYTPMDSFCEPLVLTQATPTIVTIPNPPSGTVGATLNDNATLAGGVNPTGSITFRLFAPSDASCLAAAVFTNSVPVNAGNATYPTSAGYVSTTAGTYHWTASYSGDTNNASASSACAEEPVVLIQAKATPNVDTEIHKEPGHTPTTSVPAGSSVHDKATVSGSAGTPTGTVNFTFYASGNCSTGGTTQSNVALSGGSAESSSHGPLAAGSYSFKAHYNGSSTYTEADSPCEPLTVTPRRGQCDDKDEDRGHGRVKDERDGHGGDSDFDECDDDHHATHRDTDRNVDFQSTRHNAPKFEPVTLGAPTGTPGLSGLRATTIGEGLNNGAPVTYILIVTDLGIGPGTDLYSLTLSDATGVIYTMTGTLEDGDIVVVH